jgi:hypothetical protein
VSLNLKNIYANNFQSQRDTKREALSVELVIGTWQLTIPQRLSLLAEDIIYIPDVQTWFASNPLIINVFIKSNSALCSPTT